MDNQEIEQETTKSSAEQIIVASTETSMQQTKKIGTESLEKKGEEMAMQVMKERNSNIWFYSLLAVLVIGMILFRGYWKNNFGGVVVDGASMNQTLQDGDELLMKRLKDTNDLKHGDVIVVSVSGYEEFAGSNTEYIIKRLIAMEGDKVRCTDGQVEICYAGTTEYVVLEETYAYYFRPMEEYDFAEYVVGEGEIFFLGDNRNNSLDSRYQEDNSRLDRLYKEEDVYGVVPQWAIDNRAWLEKIFFWND